VVNYKKRKDLSRKSGSGRKKSQNGGDREYILKTVNRNPRLSALKMALKLEIQRSTVVDRRTISNFPNSIGFHSRIRCEKPLLSKKNRDRRFAIVSKWIYYPLGY
jgi:hypothetical protein